MKHFVIIVTICLLHACGESPSQLSAIEGEQLPVNDSLAAAEEIEAFIAPYRLHVDQIMDSVLAYAPKPYKRTDGDLNSSLGNLMADIVMEQVNPIFKSRTGKSIDMVLLNYGGIRAPISAGPVTARVAYQVMPFENMVVVVQMPGKAMDSLFNYLGRADRAHPVSGVQLELGDGKKFSKILIQGEPLDKNKTYQVATSDYLYKGGDHFNFFKMADTVASTDYLLRNTLIDYFKKVDTLRAEADNRFIKVD